MWPKQENNPFIYPTPTHSPPHAQSSLQLPEALMPMDLPQTSRKTCNIEVNTRVSENSQIQLPSKQTPPFWRAILKCISKP